MSHSDHGVPFIKPVQSEEETNLDPSVLQRPINVGVRNIQQVLGCIQNGTAEVRDLIFNECTIIYECKVCSNLFRSLANFLAHKRFYCTEHCCEYVNFHRSEASPLVVIQPEKPTTSDEDMENLSGHATQLLSKLPSDIQGSVDTQESPTVVIPLGSKDGGYLDSEENSLEGQNDNSQAVAQDETKPNVKNKEIVVELKEIPGNPNAVFQQVCTVKVNEDTLRDHKADCSNQRNIMSKLDANCEGPNIRIIIPNPNSLTPPSANSVTNSALPMASTSMTRKKRLECRKDCDINTLSCLKCQTMYTSIKTLYLHMMTIHAQKRLFYPCLYCSASFVQVWGVIRHIVTAHQKTKEQATKLREVIRRRAFIKKVNAGSMKGSPGTLSTAIQSPTKKPLQFSGSLPKAIPSEKSDVFHPCGKCGRMFNRKSSQISHEKFCKAGSATGETVVAKPPPPTHSPYFPERNIPSSSISTRPKRFTEKKVPKDFVNSQNLKWKSANKVEMNSPKKSEKQNSPESIQKQTFPGRRMSEASVAKKALSIMDKQRLVCLKCHRKFFSMSNLFRHVAIHVGWTRFKCKNCSYQSYSRSDCRNHIQRVHRATDTSMLNIDKLIIDLPSLGTVIDKEEEMTRMKKKGSLTSSSSKQGTSPKTKQTDAKYSKSRSTPERRKRASGDKSGIRDSSPRPVSCTPFIITARKSGTSTAVRTQLASRQGPGGMDSSMICTGGEGHYIPTRHSVRATDSASLTTLVTRSGIYPKAMLFPMNLYNNERNRIKKTTNESDTKLKCDTT